MYTREKHIRRWLLPPGREETYAHLPVHRIHQAFLGPRLGTCVRITDGTLADLTRTSGHGRHRRMSDPEPLTISAAKKLIASAEGVANENLRYADEAWKFYHFLKPYRDVVFAERVMQAPDEKFDMPPWLDGATEITGFLTKRKLATMASLLGPDDVLTYEQVRQRVRRVGVTGGPMSGKDSFLEHLFRNRRDRVLPLLEVASFVIGGGRIPPPLDVPHLNRVFQKGIYRIQLELEELAELQARRTGIGIVVANRGTVDGAGYFAGGTEEFCRTAGTTMAEELGRYDRIIVLGMPPREVYERIQADAATRNDSRYETYDQALARGSLTVLGYERHPDLRYVTGATMEEKILNAEDALLAPFSD